MFVCDVPRSTDDFLEIMKTEHRLFGEMALSEADAMNIFDFCPEIYSAIYNDSQTIVGYSSIFPMQEQYASDFISGSIGEPDLKPHMLVKSNSEYINTSLAYIGSVVVLEQYGAITRSILLASLLSWRMTQMSRLALRRMPVFMIAVSDQGDQMVRFVGARKLNDGSKRKDGKSVFGRSITPGFMARANNSLQRCMAAGLVQMKFDNCHEAVRGAMR
jgi:hypothetical protein